MTDRPGQSGVWTRHRWLVFVALIFVAQIFLIFWLGEWSGRQTRVALGHRPRIYLPKEQMMNLPGVDKPTLFVLASRDGFSGPAWLNVPPVNYDSPVWRDQPRPLLQPIGQLGLTLTAYVGSNYSKPFEVVDPPEPRWTFAGYYPPVDPATNQSTVTVEGDLAGRRLLSDLRAAAWPALDILTDTSVQIGVDADGLVFDAVVLPSVFDSRANLPKSSSADAEANALALARSARFEPLRRGAAELAHPVPENLTWGRLVFHWVTTAPPATNAAPPPRSP